MIAPDSVVLISSLQMIFHDEGFNESKAREKAFEYLKSDSLQYVPFIRICAMLWASIARKAASGRKKPPTQGMANDINILSVLLPYCDAIFIDKECHGYLSEKPLIDEIDYGTKIFSLTNKDAFLVYLGEIESRATKEHIEAVKEVYGEKWKEPYLTLYKMD